MTFEVYCDEAGEWRWRLCAANGKIVADSGEGYSRKGSCLRAVDRVMAGARDAQLSVL